MNTYNFMITGEQYVSKRQIKITGRALSGYNLLRHKPSFSALFTVFALFNSFVVLTFFYYG